MYYGSGTVDRIASGQLANAGAGRTLHVHSPDGTTFLHEMTSWSPSWKCYFVSEIWLVDWCVFTWRTILPNFIRILFEMMELWAFLKMVIATRCQKTSWGYFLTHTVYPLFSHLKIVVCPRLLWELNIDGVSDKLVFGLLLTFNALKMISFTWRLTVNTCWSLHSSLLHNISHHWSFVDFWVFIWTFCTNQFLIFSLVAFLLFFVNLC